MKYIDLHTHTTASDGTYTPKGLIEYAIEKKLAAIAITDHDTIDGIIESKTYYDNNNSIEIISGIEFSTNDPKYKSDIHILGLYIDERNELFKERLNKIVQLRNERNIKMIGKLNDLGFDITIDDVLANASDGVITRAHFGKALFHKGYVKTLKDAFAKYIGNDCVAYVPREKLLPADAINMIKNASGIPVLAHPTLYHLNTNELDQLVKTLKSEGLEGIEAIYPLYTNKETAKMKSLAAKYQLLITGGSDFHGDNKPDIDLGVGMNNILVPYDILEKMKSRLQ